MKYRAEVDGLRTVAVMAVMLAHAGFKWFSGGYVGVDIFFVISGYLISTIILDGLDNGDFSILMFYERRARRILPALFIVLASCLAAGWFFMGADSYHSLAENTIATALFSNNMLLAATSGYWDMESNFKPLLHTWSLGVEEQYYALVPLLMICVQRLSHRHMTAAIVSIGLLSLLAALACVNYLPDANFYLLPTRAWELAAGAIVALETRNRNTPPSSPVLALLGLAMILAAIIFFPEALPSPSLYTVVPVLGSVLIIGFCRAGLVYKILTFPPMVGVGLISYSAYLWHQPLFVFLRVIDPNRPMPWMFAALIVVTLGLAYLSWRFVEGPFRNRARVSSRTLLFVLIPSALLLVGAGAVITHGGGLPKRLPVAPGSPAPGTYKAFNKRVFAYKADSFSQAAPRKLLVVGNSTARDFVNMVIETHSFPSYNIVYRDDVSLCQFASLSPKLQALVRSATLIVSVYDHKYGPTCDARTLANLPEFVGKTVFVGAKDFGVNLNPIARIALDKRAGVRVAVSNEALKANQAYRAITPPSLYVDILADLSITDGTIPIFDDAGRMLSEDRVHLTRPGAAFVGARVFRDSIWQSVIKSSDARAAANTFASPRSSS